MRSAVLFALSGLFLGCAQKQTEVQDKLYFDLSGFIMSEVYRLAALDTCVTKFVKVDNSSETQVFSRTDTTFWKNELGLLFQADINLPAYRGMYKKTIVKSAVWDSTVLYEAQSETAPTRSLAICYVDGNITMIEASQSEQNAVYLTKRDLKYVPDSLYTIESMQNTRGSKQKRFVIEGRIGCD